MIKIKKLYLILFYMTILNSCSNAEYPEERKDSKNDCSSIFESSPLGINDLANNSECKILEVKVDRNTKCKVVGSDRIDNLAKSLEENREEKIIFIVPKKKLQNLGQVAQKYLESNNINFDKYLELDIFDDFPFAYKGMKCAIRDKKFVLWIGEKKVVLTVNGV